MKHKTWFRLVLKAIGIVLIAYALPQAAAYGASLIYVYQLQGAAMPVFWWHFSHTVAPVLQLMIGLYLLFGGKALLNWIIPSNHPYCPECGYNLSATHPDAARCVECGVTLPNEWASLASNVSAS